MSRVAIGKRLADLEQRASNVRQEHIVCTPMIDNLLSSAVELAPGVFTSRYHYPNKYMTRSILYTDRALLDQWLALSEQKDSRHCVYHVLSKEECDKIRAELNASC